MKTLDLIRGLICFALLLSSLGGSSRTIANIGLMYVPLLAIYYTTLHSLISVL